MVTTKIRPVGSSHGVILSKEVLESASLSNGEQVFVVPLGNSVLITPNAEGVAVEDVHQCFLTQVSSLTLWGEVFRRAVVGDWLIREQLSPILTQISVANVENPVVGITVGNPVVTVPTDGTTKKES